MRTRCPAATACGLLLALLSAALAGCLERPAEAPPTTPAPRQDMAPVVYANNATACTRVFAALFVERAHAQIFLPPGFTAGDSSQFFGQPGPASGRGVLIVSVMRCGSSELAPQGYDEATAGIFVHPPRLNGSAVPGEHFYDLGRAYAEGAVADILHGLQWPRLGTQSSLTYAGGPARAATAAVRDPDGAVFTVSLPAAPIEDSFTGTLHLYWWHQNDEGLSSFEYVFRPEGYLGEATCNARAGSLIARVLGSTPCTPLVMVGPPFDAASRLESRARARVDP